MQNPEDGGCRTHLVHTESEIITNTKVPTLPAHTFKSPQAVPQHTHTHTTSTHTLNNTTDRDTTASHLILHNTQHKNIDSPPEPHHPAEKTCTKCVLQTPPGARIPVLTGCAPHHPRCCGGGLGIRAGTMIPGVFDFVIEDACHRSRRVGYGDARGKFPRGRRICGAQFLMTRVRPNRMRPARQPK